MKIVLEIPEASPSKNQLLRHHWGHGVRTQAHWDKLVREALQIWLYELPDGKDSLPVALLQERMKAFRPAGKRRVTVIRQAPRLLEELNFLGGLAPVIDALRLRRNRKSMDFKGTHLILDDSEAMMENGPHRQVKGPKGTVIIVEDVESGSDKA